MLTTVQQEALVFLVLNELGFQPTPSAIANYVGEHRVLTMPAIGMPAQLARWLIDEALSQPGPQLLIRIVRDVDNGTDRVASLVELADRLTADPTLWRARASGLVGDWSLDRDPLHVLDGRPFVDRGAFRQLLPRLGSVATPGCTVIRGDSGHGKSYLYEFCKQLRKHWGEAQPDMLRVGYAECPRGNLSSMRVDIVALSLATGLRTGSTFQPTVHEDRHRYARNLATWILSGTPPGPLPALVILDGFRARTEQDRIPEEVLLFIEELVRGVQEDQETRERMRILLLDYDTSRLEQQGLDFEASVLEWIDDQAVERWFRERFPGQPDYRYEDTVASIQAKLAAQAGNDTSPLRMRYLCTLIEHASLAFETA